MSDSDAYWNSHVDIQTSSVGPNHVSDQVSDPGGTVVNAPNCDADVARELAFPPLRILVVEDEGLIALNLELILRRFGCEIVGPISEVGDIVGAARDHRPDGAFLDVNLRGRKVFDVLPEMLSLGVPCVLSSGYDDPMLFPAAYRDMPRIAKPFDESALRRACVQFGSLAESQQVGGEHGAVPFRRPRRAPVPALPAEGEADTRIVAGWGRR